jgi:7-keto-8-aminopelargonate synthetase-like enzyme
VNIIASQPDLSDRLWRNAKQLHEGLRAAGLDVCAAIGPVGSIRMRGVKDGHDFWTGLLDRGVYVNMLLPPATPNGEVLLRFSVSAAHTPEQIAKALTVFSEVARAKAA